MRRTVGGVIGTMHHLYFERRRYGPLPEGEVVADFMDGHGAAGH